MPIRFTGRQLGLGGAALALWLFGLFWFRPWIAHDDFAIFRIALERELDGHVRLVGAHSRLGVFHPGPLREWVFALPYWLSGRRTAALPATAVVLNAGWAIWTLVVAHRFRPRAWGAACALGLLLVVRSIGADLGSPWNPHLAILPMYLACWSLITVIARRGEGWVACVCAASFAAQLHASVLVVAGTVLAVALISLASQRLWRESVLALGVAVLLWAGPIVDLRKGADANLIRLRTVGTEGVAVGVRDAVGHVSRLLWPGTPLSRISVRPSIVEFTGFYRWWLLIVVAVVAGVSVATAGRRRADRQIDQEPDDGDHDSGNNNNDSNGLLAVVAGAVAVCVVVLAIISVSLFVEPAYRYLYGPLQAAAVFVMSVALGAVVITIERRSGLAVPRVEWFASAVVPIVLVGVLLTVPREDGAAAERRALGVDDAVSAALAARPDWRSVEALPLDLRGAGDLDAEVLDVVLRRGVDARSRRLELGLPAPEDVDGVFGVAMSPRRDCLLAEPGVDEIIRGVSAAGETFSVIAVRRPSVAYDRCIGPPAG